VPDQPAQGSADCRPMRPNYSLIGFRLRLAVLVVSAAWPISAFGQAGAPAMPAAPAAGEGGARRFDVSAVGRAEYDTNVARGSSALASVRGVRKDDIKYTPSVTVDLGSPLGRQYVFLTGSVGYEFYQYNQQLERERISATGGTSGQFGRCGGALVGSYTRGTTDFEDLTLEAQRTIEESRTGALNLSCRLGSNIGHTIAYQRSELRRSGGTAFRPDATSDSVSTALSYGNPVIGSIAVTAAYATTDYEDGAVPFPASPGFEVYSVGMQYSRPIGARLTGSLAGAYYKLKADDPTAPNSDGWSANVGLQYRASARLEANALYDRAISASRRVGANSTLAQRAQLAVRYRIGTRITTSLSGTWRRRTYDAPPVGSALLTSREESQTVRGSISTDIGRRLTLLLDAAHEEVDTDVDVLDYTAEKVGVTLTTRF
jgi:hypothetical protein